MFLSEWLEFPSAPCLAEKKPWWQLASRCCWNRVRPWHASELVSFLVGLRTYQHPGTAGWTDTERKAETSISEQKLWSLQSSISTAADLFFSILLFRTLCLSTICMYVKFVGYDLTASYRRHVFFIITPQKSLLIIRMNVYYLSLEQVPCPHLQWFVCYLPQNRKLPHFIFYSTKTLLQITFHIRHGSVTVQHFSILK